VFKSGVCGQDTVVGFNHSSGHLWSRVDGELKLGFFAIVNGETFHEQRGKPRASTTPKGVEDEETLKAGTLVSKLSDTVKNNINNLLSNSVMATGIVVGSILLASDQLFRMEKLTIGASTYLICKGMRALLRPMREFTIPEGVSFP